MNKPHMAPNDKITFHGKVEYAFKNNDKVNFLLKTSYREDHNTVISYISVWWEVALEIDFFQKTDCIKFTKMQNRDFGHE